MLSKKRKEKLSFRRKDPLLACMCTDYSETELISATVSWWQKVVSQQTQYMVVKSFRGWPCDTFCCWRCSHLIGPRWEDTPVGWCTYWFRSLPHMALCLIHHWPPSFDNNSGFSEDLCLQHQLLLSICDICGTYSQWLYSLNMFVSSPAYCSFVYSLVYFLDLKYGWNIMWV